MTAQLRIVKRDRAEYALRVRNTDIGHLRDGIARFHGFATLAEARAAGVALRDVLGAWYRERARAGHAAPLTPLPAAAASGAEVLSLDGVAVGRIAANATSPDAIREDRSLDLEFALPEHTPLAVLVPLIWRLHAAMPAGDPAAAAATATNTSGVSA